MSSALRYRSSVRSARSPAATRASKVERNSEGPVASPLTFELERDYWLNRCVGFDVEAEGRLCGRVALQKYRSRPDRPDALVVQNGHCPVPSAGALPLPTQWPRSGILTGLSTTSTTALK